MPPTASSAAPGWTMRSSEPARKTVAWTTASHTGSTPRSAGISGKIAAPSGTSAPSASSGGRMSASGHGGDDGQLVAVGDRRGQVVEVGDVLVVGVDGDEAADLVVVDDP